MRSAVQVPGAPQAIGPYSQAQVIALPGGHRLVYTSGQVALDPASGQMVAGGIAEQTERALTNLGAVLSGAGVSFADVVKTTVFLVDMNDFAEMNKTYERFFTGSAPARSTVAVAALPRAGRVEIEAIAIGRDA